MKPPVMLRLLAVVAAWLPASCLACACGCGVFSVGTGALVADGTGQVAFLEYGYVDQDQNWSGTASAPATDNDDKELRTSFYTAGAQFAFGRDWSASFSVPYLDRSMTSTESGLPVTVRHTGLGDLRVSGKYTGFSEDRSTGIDAGLKLPTGDYSFAGLDRDSALGTGTTDLLLGAYHLANLGADKQWTSFLRVQWSSALAARAGYRPGDEFDAVWGISYAGWEFGRHGALAPVLQLIGVDRGRDSGAASDPADTGYRKLLLAPGIELDEGDFKLYAEVEFAAFQSVEGDQLTARRQYKATISYRF
jgi:hypothetical protein